MAGRVPDVGGKGGPHESDDGSGMTNVRRLRLMVAMTTAALALGGVAATSAQASTSDTEAQNQMLLVHGYGDAEAGKDCNDSTWDEALDYYEDAGGRDRSSMTTIGYYVGDHDCDATIGDGAATNERPIQDIARDFANYIYDYHTNHGETVDIVAHSMGGLVTRVALLGTGEGWEGFPPELYVDNIVTLGTPHQGLIDGCGDVDDADCTRQWNQMTTSYDGGSGFIDALHESGRGLDDPWASGIDWSLVSSIEDTTVSYYSGIDKGYTADQKYGYDEDLSDNGTADCSDPDVSHSGIRELTGAGGYCLRYWHSGADGGPYTTENGWSPLKVAFKAATYDGDDLPR